MITHWRYDDLLADSPVADLVAQRLDAIRDVGFTGRAGEVLDVQALALRAVLAALERRARRRARARRLRLPEGDCVGADELAARTAREMGYLIVAHPPDDPSMRAFFPADETRPEKPASVRNEDIAGETDVLVALPPSDVDLPQSGTWETVRCARRARRPVLLLTPLELRLERPPALVD